jgi:hypothetical protein
MGENVDFHRRGIRTRSQSRSTADRGNVEGGMGIRLGYGKKRPRYSESVRILNRSRNRARRRRGRIEAGSGVEGIGRSLGETSGRRDVGEFALRHVHRDERVRNRTSAEIRGLESEGKRSSRNG